MAAVIAAAIGFGGVKDTPARAYDPQWTVSGQIAFVWPRQYGYYLYFYEPLPTASCSNVVVISTTLPDNVYESYVSTVLTAFASRRNIQVIYDADACPSQTAPVIELVMWQ